VSLEIERYGPAPWLADIGNWGAPLSKGLEGGEYVHAGGSADSDVGLLSFPTKRKKKAGNSRG